MITDMIRIGVPVHLINDETTLEHTFFNICLELRDRRRPPTLEERSVLYYIQLKYMDIGGPPN